MQAIQNTVRRLFAMTTVLTIKAALLRACGKQVPSQVMQSTEPAPEIVTECIVAGAEDETEDRFAAWEVDRDEKLHEAEEYELQGLRLLSRAALLHAAVRCDDRGETFLAEELREHATTIGSESDATAVSADTI
jgi:hypothetical protein